jgi:hypothetical protein
MRNKQDIAVLILFSVSLREIHSVKLRVINKKTQSYTEEISRRDTELMVTCYLFFIPEHGVSQREFHRVTRSIELCVTP